MLWRKVGRWHSLCLNPARCPDAPGGRQSSPEDSLKLSRLEKLVSQRDRRAPIQDTINKTISLMNEHNNTRLAVILLALWPGLAGAVGYRLPNQDPEAIARGNAYVATADNPSAIYYNPAGITQLEGQSVRAG